MATQQASLTIGSYLLDRLAQLGVDYIFGIPGDYVIRLDKLIEEHSIRFINTTRESCSGYAADAYARFKGLGVACITYGVGLSIANAVALAYVESSPLVILSGNAGTEEFKRSHDLHHLINTSTSLTGDLTQLEIFKNVTIDQGILDDPTQAAAIIDRVLLNCLQHKKPVYLEIPRNLVEIPLPPHSTLQPLKWSYPSSDLETLAEALNETHKILSACQKPLIWVGPEISRFCLAPALLAFAERCKIPIVSSLSGKCAVSEHHPLFVGIYQGKMSTEEIERHFHEADCVLILGVIQHDLDTGMFSHKSDHPHHITANAFDLKIGRHKFPDVSLIDYVQGLEKLNLPVFTPTHISRAAQVSPFIPRPNTPTTTQRVFECLQSHLSSEHILIADTGDCLFGSSDLILYQDSFIASSYFASLGFAVPAAIGTQFANPQKRAVIIAGDGGFQMTATELSTAVRYGLDPVVIVLNNHGYGTERPLLEGSYNDIQNWDYTKIPELIRGGKGARATTEEELSILLNEAFSQRGSLYLVEVELDKLDFSPALKRLGEMLGKIVKS